MTAALRRAAFAQRGRERRSRSGLPAVLAALFAAGPLAAQRAADQEAATNSDRSAERDRPAVYATWVVDPAEPGADQPPAGRSLFDEVFTEGAGGRIEYAIPFPFDALLAELERRTGGATRQLLIPLGRSLQRNAANPDFFQHPRVVVAAAEPGIGANGAGRQFADRLFLGYQERAATIEVISYNETAGRFEFQVVSNYGAGAAPEVRYAKRSECVPCHQNHGPIFSRPLWDETHANADVAARLRATGRDFFGVAVESGVDVAEAFDAATDRANLLSAYQAAWMDGCGRSGGADAVRCRADALLAVLRYRLAGRRVARVTPGVERDAFHRSLRANWPRFWPQGLAIPNPDIPNRKLALFKADRGPIDLPGNLHGQPLAAHEIAALAVVPRELEPFEPRPPLEVWHAANADAALIARITAGLASFLTDGDIRSLDEHLASRAPTARAALSVPCEIRPRSFAGDESADDITIYRIVCRAEHATGTVALDGTLSRGRRTAPDAPPAPMSGVVHRLSLPGLDELRGHSIAVGAASGGELELRFADAALGLRARSTDGNALGVATLATRNAELAGPAAMTLRIESDFAAVVEAVDGMRESTLNGTSDALGARPFRRASIVAELFERLGARLPAGCCSVDADRPAASPTDVASPIGNEP